MNALISSSWATQIKAFTTYGLCFKICKTCQNRCIDRNISPSVILRHIVNWVLVNCHCVSHLCSLMETLFCSKGSSGRPVPGANVLISLAWERDSGAIISHYPSPGLDWGIWSDANANIGVWSNPLAWEEDKCIIEVENSKWLIIKLEWHNEYCLPASQDDLRSRNKNATNSGLMHMHLMLLST